MAPGLVRRATAASLLIAVVVLGCGRSGPPLVEVRGTLQYQGKPLTNGAIMFNPMQDGVGHVANSSIGPLGEFRMSTFTAEDGVMPGEYAITVRSFKVRPGANLEDPLTIIGSPLCVPKRYSDPAKSDLRCTISADSAAQDLTLSLTD